MGLEKDARFPRAVGGFGHGWRATKPELIEEIIAMKSAGISLASIARRTGVPLSTVHRITRGCLPKTKERQEI